MKYYCKRCYEQEGRRHYLDGKRCPNCNRIVAVLPQPRLGFLKNSSISRFKNDSGFSIGGMNSPHTQDDWKTNVYKKPLTTKESRPMIKPKKQILIDIFDEKKEYKIIIEGTNKCLLKDNVLIVGDDERKQEITIPKNVKLDTMEKKTVNAWLMVVFKKEKTKKQTKKS